MKYDLKTVMMLTRLMIIDVTVNRLIDFQSKTNEKIKAREN